MSESRTKISIENELAIETIRELKAIDRVRKRMQAAAHMVGCRDCSGAFWCYCPFGENCPMTCGCGKLGFKK